MRDPSLTQLWEKLQSRHERTAPFLRHIHIDQLRGIKDLTVTCGYPVSVVAGERGCGKSTVLLAAACGYEKPSGTGLPNYSPDYLFSSNGLSEDESEDVLSTGRFGVSIESNEGAVRVDWTRSSTGWVRAYHESGEPVTLVRECYLRAEAKLRNRSQGSQELSESRKQERGKERLPPPQVTLAKTMVPRLFRHDVASPRGRGELERFEHLLSGADDFGSGIDSSESTALRMGLDLAEIRDALVLIDDVERGVGEHLQERLMVGLHQLALWNNLQLIISTRSSVVLDSVPAVGRLLLEITSESGARLKRTYCDPVRNEMYGKPVRGFNLLCEGEAAEAVLNGVLDHLNPVAGWTRADIQVRRDADTREFLAHAGVLERHGVLSSFAFVLDRDHEGAKIEQQLRRVTNQPIIHLPREGAAAWVWSKLQGMDGVERYAAALGLSQKEYKRELASATAILFGASSDTRATKSMKALTRLAEVSQRSVPEVCHIVARTESESGCAVTQAIGASVCTAFAEWQSSCSTAGS